MTEWDQTVPHWHSNCMPNISNLTDFHEIKVCIDKKYKQFLGISVNCADITSKFIQSQPKD